MGSGNNFFLDSNRNKDCILEERTHNLWEFVLLGGDIKGLVWNGCSCMMNGECLDFFLG